MIRSQKPPIYNPSATMQEITPSIGDINSYLGKILTINHYQVAVESILGQGGFAFVFLVRSFNQVRYALKRMYVNNRRDLLVCQREIALLRELSSHPNIVKYVDASIRRLSPRQLVRPASYQGQNETKDDSDDDDDAIHEILLLTEYCTYGALVTRLHEQRKLGINLTEQQILHIFADICRAVSACHFRRPQPILHRDIKLENIIINSRQCYVLCDFGSAILLSPTTKASNEFQQYSTEQLTTHTIHQLEEDIQRYTTVSYRAPEMVDLYSRVPITLKADIWAMGCLLYKLMYNTMPFGESILAIQNGTFVISDDLAHVYSRELNLLVRCMLEIDTAKRPDIWQVSYLTFKLLGHACPIPNPCQSKTPDLTAISLPLTDSQSRQQRTLASMKTKSTSTNVINESSSVGTAVNPRERPRGMMAPSGSLLSFTPTPTVQSAPKTVQSPPSSAPSRSDSAAQLLFDDDFSQIPSHANSLTNIFHAPSITGPNSNERTISRARPSPPGTLSSASGLSMQQQQQALPPLPPPPSSTLPGHRRSASQTITSTNNQSPFPNASSVDSAMHLQHLIDARNRVPAMNPRLPVTLDDDKNLFQITSPEHQVVKQNPGTQQKSPSNHHPTTEEAENSNQLNHVNEQLSRRIEQGPSSSFSTTSQTAILPTNSSSQDLPNPFLDAPFHHSSPHQQRVPSNTILPPSASRSSVDAPYQKQQSNLNAIWGSASKTTASSDSLTSVSSRHRDNIFANAPLNSTTLSTKTDHSYPSVSLSSSSAFIHFNHRDLSKSSTSSTLPARPAVGSSSGVKQFVHLPRTNTISSNEHSINRVQTGLEPKQTVYGNLSYANTAVEEYF